MKVAVLCDPGAEGACAGELSMSIISNGHGFVLAEGSKQEIVDALYRSQTALDILLLLDDAEDIIRSHDSFAARCETQEDNELVGAFFKDRYGKVVNLDNPEIIVGKAGDHIGLSLAGRELRKREYRVFTSNKSLRPTTAAAFLRLAGFDGSQRLLLPLEDDGTLSIEAAFMTSGVSPRKYDNDFLASRYWGLSPSPRSSLSGSIDAMVSTVQFLKAVKRNAKIAGVHKSIKVTKAGVDWIDTRFDEGFFDLAVAFIPGSGKHHSLKESTKIVDELSYQASYVLKPGGTLGIITIKPWEIVPNHKFLLSETLKIMMGCQELSLLIFRKAAE